VPPRARAGGSTTSTTPAARAWADRYRRRGFATAKIRPGEKQPAYRGWNLRSLEPEDFAPGDNLAILTGRLSGDLVCVDLDSARALELANEYLPPTAMVSGRPASRAATASSGSRTSPPS
jgi:hypothetical protein